MVDSQNLYIIIFLLVTGCDVYDSSRIKIDANAITSIEPKDSSATDSLINQDSYIGDVKDISDTKIDTGVPVRNFCEEAFNLKMDVIKTTCMEFENCCYCDCEISDAATCDCSRYSFLVKNFDYSRCIDVESSRQCIEDSISCTIAVKGETIRHCTSSP